ncbi:MAG: PhnD/SsuA/transferrin family substrate-binding protein [Kiloniellaceae bacterium]
MRLIACTRMYNVTPGARRAWARLFNWVSKEAGVALETVEHAAPAPLEDLWRRPDMGCVFMCGLPFSRSLPQPQVIAAPIPSAARYKGRARYFTDLIVRRDRGFRDLEDTFGGSIGWTVEGSHSGFNAPRHHLLAHRSENRPRLYKESLGPAVTPAASLAWVIEGKVDIAPLDSYALDLMRHHEPAWVAEIEAIASTAAAPIPPLVASSAVGPAACDALRRTLLSASANAKMTPVLEDLCLSGFTAVPAEDYEIVRTRETEALAAGYRQPE